LRAIGARSWRETRRATLQAPVESLDLRALDEPPDLATRHPRPHQVPEAGDPLAIQELQCAFEWGLAGHNISASVFKFR
jgi:hypothetical protein